MKLTLTRMLDIHGRITRRIKTTSVEHVHGPTDLNPLLFVTFDDGTHWAGRAIESQMGEDFVLGDVIAADLLLLWTDHHRPVDRIIIVADAYVQPVAGNTDEEAKANLSHYNRGDSGRDYRTNPNSTVYEAMFTSFVWYDDGAIFTNIISQRYYHGEGGVLCWDEPTVGTPALLTEDTVGNHGGAIETAYAVVDVTHQVVKEEA